MLGLFSRYFSCQVRWEVLVRPARWEVLVRSALREGSMQAGLSGSLVGVEQGVEGLDLAQVVCLLGLEAEGQFSGRFIGHSFVCPW